MLGSFPELPQRWSHAGHTGIRSTNSSSLLLQRTGYSGGHHCCGFPLQAKLKSWWPDTLNWTKKQHWSWMETPGSVHFNYVPSLIHCFPPIFAISFLWFLATFFLVALRLVNEDFTVQIALPGVFTGFRVQTPAKWPGSTTFVFLALFSVVISETMALLYI